MRSLLTLISFISLSSCQEPTVSSANLDRPFTLAYGKSAYFGEAQTVLTFTDVKGDSRCPESVYCQAAGGATLIVSLSKAATPKAELSIGIYGHKTAGDTSYPYHYHVDTLGLRLTLLQVDPYPKKLPYPEKSAYVATLLLQRKD